MKILPDGSVEGGTFSGKKYKGEYPSPDNKETYREYHTRVQKCVKKGFHLGDLKWSDYHDYCYGNYGNFAWKLIGDELPEEERDDD